MSFVELFNYHPWGQDQLTEGSLSYGLVPTLERTYVNGLWAGHTGSALGVVREGGVCGGWGTAGCSSPSDHDIGTPGVEAGSMFDRIVTGTFNDPRVDTLANNAAGMLKWDTGALAADGTKTFTLELVPEPGTWALMAIGLGLLVAARKRFRA